MDFLFETIIFTYLLSRRRPIVLHPLSSGKFGGQDPPPPVYKEPVPTGAPEVPVGPIINNPDVSAEGTPQEENVEEVTVDEIIPADDIIEPDDEIEGPEGPMINRRNC